MKIFCRKLGLSPVVDTSPYAYKHHIEQGNLQKISFKIWQPLRIIFHILKVLASQNRGVSKLVPIEQSFKKVPNDFGSKRHDSESHER